MIDGEIIRKTDRPDGSADLDYRVPEHRAIVIWRAVHGLKETPEFGGHRGND
jgi:hypothetical protein